MPHRSAPELLVLHALRLQGIVKSADISRRFGVDPATVEELLLDDEAHGLVRRMAFADVSGWTITDAGRAADDARLAAELAGSGARDTVTRAHDAFIPLNDRFLTAVTRWQVRPTSWDPVAANDHTDWAWDEGVLSELTSLGAMLTPLLAAVIAELPRFGGYSERYAAALAKVDKGQRRWVDEPGLDSCHAVWFEVHQDLLTTLGIARGR